MAEWRSVSGALYGIRNSKAYLVLAATASAVAASQHQHQHKHAHLHDRAVYTHTDVVATATVFQANGTPISKDEACQGVAEGHYLGLGGWSGIQSPTYGVDAITDIVTAISGGSCKEGDLCSYACPPGYQKSQWPTTQGSTGQSVGGIECSGGKLKLTNSALSKTLCIEGVGGVSATNKAGKVVAICRTDYPGTESETIPVELQSGDTQPLAVPDASSYYTWQGKSTSAQYYLNPPGYSAEEACQWGSSDTPIGNFAPTNFGVGYSAGKTWLSIFPNAPTTDVEYPGTIEIQGDNLSGSCKYSNGKFESDTGTSTTGCTVAVISGSATFVIS
ncbi:hypothetical protein DV735_g5354, partial [Chaetothyriales sp. CBS 134920]